MASITAAVRKLPWWAGPVTVSVALVLFTLYALWLVFFQRDGSYQHLLSPFYSPRVGVPDWLPNWVTAPMLVLWIPLGFRGTCYYYRKAYFRAFFWDPPACSGKAQQHEPRSAENYRGERALFVINNIHRYFLYGSIIVVAFLWYEAILAFLPGGSFGVTVGSLLWLTNIALLSLYTFSCHSFRHLVGGNKDCYTCIRGGNFRRGLYNKVSLINTDGRHALWAWLSLFSLLITDLYIRLLQAGVITDLRIL